VLFIFQGFAVSATRYAGKKSENESLLLTLEAPIKDRQAADAMSEYECQINFAVSI
jgi:hypothetical protein